MLKGDHSEMGFSGDVAELPIIPDSPTHMATLLKVEKRSLLPADQRKRNSSDEKLPNLASSVNPSQKSSDSSNSVPVVIVPNADAPRWKPPRPRS